MWYVGCRVHHAGHKCSEHFVLSLILDHCYRLVLPTTIVWHVIEKPHAEFSHKVRLICTGPGSDYFCSPFLDTLAYSRSPKQWVAVCSSLVWEVPLDTRSCFLIMIFRKKCQEQRSCVPSWCILMLWQCRSENEILHGSHEDNFHS